jgi:hypothetical protein
MSIVINLLIIFFILLLLTQIFLAYYKKKYSFEGLETMTYKEYDTNNPNNIMILTQQNSGNIEYLKQQIDSLLGLQKQVSDISGNLVSLSEQVQGIVQTQQQYASQQLPSQTPTITGA